MKVKPKLYLNGSPQTAEEGSLAFARNMKIDNDGNLVSDYGYENIKSLQDYKIVGIYRTCFFSSFSSCWFYRLGSRCTL